MMDFYSDPGHSTLKHLLSRSPAAAEFVKTAEFEDFSSDLPSSAFAWSSKRMYPVHTPEHAVVSYMYAKHASARAPKEVLTFIKEALSAYGIEEEYLELQEVKVAAFAPDECLLPAQNLYPVRNAGEVKTAEEKLLPQVGKLLPEQRAEMFTNLAKAASLHGVKLRPDSLKLAGLVYTDREKLATDLMARAAATKNPRLSEKFAALAHVVRRDRQTLRNQAEQAKLAEAIGTLDERAGFIPFYDRLLPDPIQTVFNTTKTASHNDVELGDGYMVSATSLAQLAPSFFSDLFGADVVQEIAPKGYVEPELVKTVVSTFPSDMKRQLLQALKSAGVSVAQV
jgi:hypothetical protein